MTNRIGVTMSFKDLFRFGGTNLLRRKTRTVLTALSMAVGVMCIVVLISVEVFAYKVMKLKRQSVPAAPAPSAPPKPQQTQETPSEADEQK